MSELLIPFGIHGDTGEIVEPEDAARGRGCGCICPGCKAPLLSRYPSDERRRRHFSHDSKHELAKPEEECPFNSAVAVAMMARELAKSLIGQPFYTPACSVFHEFDCCGVGENFGVSNSSKVIIDSALANVSELSHHFDLKLEVQGYSVFIDFVYKGKPPKALLKPVFQRASAGVLQIDCESFSLVTFREYRAKRFSEVVMEFLLKNGVREWRFHPRTAAVVKGVESNHRCRDRYPSSKSLVYETPNTRRSSPAFGFKQREQVDRKLCCVICDVIWVQKSQERWCCPECNSHLYIKEIL